MSIDSDSFVYITNSEYPVKFYEKEYEEILNDRRYNFIFLIISTSCIILLMIYLIIIHL